MAEKVNVAYCSLLSKIPGGDGRYLCKVSVVLCLSFGGGRKGDERKRWVSKTYVFKEERQDVGAIEFNLNSSVHPRVITCNFCATECEIKTRKLVDEPFTEKTVSDPV